MNDELTAEGLSPIRTVMPSGSANVKVKGVIIFVRSGNEFKDKDLTQAEDVESAVSIYVAACITTHDTYETALIITPAYSAYDTVYQEGGTGPGYKKVVRAIERASNPEGGAHVVGSAVDHSRSSWDAIHLAFVSSRLLN